MRVPLHLPLFVVCQAIGWALFAFGHPETHFPEETTTTATNGNTTMMTTAEKVKLGIARCGPWTGAPHA